MPKKLTQEEFIIRATIKHGEIYSYHKVNYRNTLTKVIIVCPVHGDFTQTPNGHLRSGCKLCAGVKSSKERSVGFDEFKLRANVKFNGRFKYIESSFKTLRELSSIICPVHGLFTQTPYNHLRGSGCKSCSQDSLSKDRRLTIPEVTLKLTKQENNFYIIGYKNNKSLINMECKTHGEYQQRLHNIVQGKSCAKCGNSFSKEEGKVFNFLSSLVNPEKQNKALIAPLELDIYVHEFKLAIEYNGAYWHSSKYKNKNYHKNKFLRCKEKGITLVSIWDWQWREKRKICLSLILHKLNMNERIYARKTKLKTITNTDAGSFYQKNHMEGCTQSVYYKDNIHLGLFYKDKLVMCTTYSKKEIVRVCTLRFLCVIGGVSKLLKKVESGCIYFSVNDMGSSSTLNGFTKVKYSGLRYWWVKGNNVFSRNSCQKSRIAKRFNINMDGHTESSAMLSLGYNRCYDSGLTKWVKD